MLTKENVKKGIEGKLWYNASWLERNVGHYTTPPPSDEEGGMEQYYWIEGHIFLNENRYGVDLLLVENEAGVGDDEIAADPVCWR